jgi:GAF domain-containing protein
VHFPDIMALDPTEFAGLQKLATLRGYAAVAAAPMLRDGTAIGAISLRRRERGPLSDRQIALLRALPPRR